MTGGLLTIVVALGYWAIATFADIDPMVSLLIVFCAASGVGYLLHSRWSFRGHDTGGSAGARGARFFLVNILGFATNQFFVWLLVKHLGGPTWWPVIPILFVTPVLTFSLNRQWVFR